MHIKLQPKEEILTLLLVFENAKGLMLCIFMVPPIQEVLAVDKRQKY